MTPAEAAWVREHAAPSPWGDIGHAWGDCDPDLAGTCFSCEDGKHDRCEAGWRIAEAHLHIGATGYYTPRGCRLPDQPTSHRVWLADRMCRAACTCTCRTRDVGLRDQRGARIAPVVDALF